MPACNFLALLSAPPPTSPHPPAHPPFAPGSPLLTAGLMTAELITGLQQEDGTFAMGLKTGEKIVSVMRGTYKVQIGIWHKPPTLRSNPLAGGAAAADDGRIARRLPMLRPLAPSSAATAPPASGLERRVGGLCQMPIWTL